MGKQVRKLLVFVLLAGIMTGCVGGGLVDPIPKYYTVSGKIVICQPFFGHIFTEQYT